MSTSLTNRKAMLDQEHTVRIGGIPSAMVLRASKGCCQDGKQFADIGETVTDEKAASGFCPLCLEALRDFPDPELAEFGLWDEIVTLPGCEHKSDRTFHRSCLKRQCRAEKPASWDRKKDTVTSRCPICRSDDMEESNKNIYHELWMNETQAHDIRALGRGTHGGLYTEDGKTYSEVECYVKTLREFDAWDPRSYYYLAEHLARQKAVVGIDIFGDGKVYRATECYKVSLLLDPSNTRCWYAFGLYLQKHRKNPLPAQRSLQINGEAIDYMACLRKAIQLHPDHLTVNKMGHRAHRSQSEVSKSWRKLGEALKAEALSQVKLSARVYTVEGCFIRAIELDSAVHCARGVTKPDSFSNWLALGTSSPEDPEKTFEIRTRPLRIARGERNQPVAATGDDSCGGCGVARTRVGSLGGENTDPEDAEEVLDFAEHAELPDFGAAPASDILGLSGSDVQTFTKQECLENALEIKRDGPDADRAWLELAKLLESSRRLSRRQD